MASIFLSYAREDTDFARRLADRLQAAGHRVWIDFSGVRGGQEWVREIDQGVRASDAFVLIISPESMDSRWVDRESLLALSLNKTVVPVMWRDAELPVHLVGIQYVDFRADFEEGFKHLQRALPDTSALKTLEQRPSPPAAPQPGGLDRPRISPMIILAAAFGVCGLLGLVIIFLVLRPITPPAGPPTTTGAPVVTPAIAGSPAGPGGGPGEPTIPTEVPTTPPGVAPSITPSFTPTPTHTPTPTPTLTPRPIGGGGNLIVFVREGDGIYTMTVNGEGLNRIFSGADRYASPVWSPDGAQIAFTPTVGGQRDLYLMNADGSGLTNLTSDSADDFDPAWSPDGSRIVWVSSRDGSRNIYIMRVSTRAVEQKVTSNQDNNLSPSWQPNGEYIAFERIDRDQGDKDIFVARQDGTGVALITYSLGGDEYDPRWSPDGQDLGFVSDGDGDLDIYHGPFPINSLVNVTDSAGNVDDGRFSWSPDGQYIVFASDRDGNWNIYRMARLGNDLQRLTSTSADDFRPSWQP